MEEDKDVPLILGQPFLATGKAFIDTLITYVLCTLNSLTLTSVRLSRASDYGLMKIDESGQITQFAEKPKGSALRAMRVDTSVLGLSEQEAPKYPYIASMGVYVFRTDVLLKLLQSKYPSCNDFGSEIIPSAVKDHNVQREYTVLNYGVRAMAINVPGFAYYKALKARKKLVATFQSIVDERRVRRRKNLSTHKKDMMDTLMEVEDENGRKLTDEEIIDVLVMYLNAGHESSGHITMWATLFLQTHPEIFEKAKAEQEAIVKNKPPGQKGITLKEVRQMEYLSKVIDETLRVVTFSFVVFREANKDVNISGYTIPRGWKVLVWFRTVHHDWETFVEPKKFDPSRWDGFTPKAGSFLPFGGGSRLCPGNDLAKLEIAIFLHYFLLGYKFERSNAACPLMYLPHCRPKDNCLGTIKKTSGIDDKILPEFQEAMNAQEEISLAGD
ncbi:ent-kaurenoic acid oxidase 2-like [Olea europaea var. sylvestris]|uniref:ent-kaurenoic acid oxidase 2-like n=1 Tax=Olea europaea var. sylvestris TaxID=158386 RepID=UPI000C1D238D|nr:ent-kaurenoic acid oxidase 2-like [Olea europaea var. sylvestris]